MPLIKLQFNGSVANSARQRLFESLSATVAEALGKPESYMMVVMEQTPMYFSQSADAAAYFEVRAVGEINAEQAADISKRVSDILRDQLQIDPGRVFSNYAGVPGAMWGHNSTTFG